MTDEEHQATNNKHPKGPKTVVRSASGTPISEGEYQSTLVNICIEEHGREDPFPVMERCIALPRPKDAALTDCPIILMDPVDDTEAVVPIVLVFDVSQIHSSEVPKLRINRAPHVNVLIEMGNHRW